MRRLCFLVVLLSGVSFAQTNPNFFVYGNAWQANSLANLQIGGTSNTSPGIRIVADDTSTIASVRIYIKTGMGYSGGTGGTTKLSIQSDDGTANHFPTGTILDSVSIATGNPPASPFITFTMNNTASTTAGTPYEIVATNTDGSPTTNFVSIDDLSNTNNTAAPYYSGSPIQNNCGTAACLYNFAMLQKTSGTWAAQNNHIPIVQVTYADGHTQGQGYVDALAGSGLFNIEGSNQAGQVFNPPSNVVATGLNLWIQKVGTPGPLTVSWQTASGTVIENDTVAAAAVSTTFTYVPSAFASNHILIGGQSYRAVLSAATDLSNYYQVFPMESGACCGFTVPSLLSSGNYQTNTGSGWSNYLSSTMYALPLFLTLNAPLAAGIIDPSRSVDWSSAGISGGIPARNTICSTIAPYNGTATTITNAIATCTAGQTVFLSAGTFNLSSGIDFAGHSNVTLRGAGANQTFLIFTGDTSCHGLGADVCVDSSSSNWFQGPDQTATWTASSYSKGQTQITLSSTTGIVVGTTVLTLDQTDDPSDPGSTWVCETQNVCMSDVASGGQRAGRAQGQLVLVTALAGSVATISPALYMPNWASARSPGAWWANSIVSYDGVENLSMDHSASNAASGVLFDNAYNSWVKGVRDVKSDRNHVWMYNAARIVVRDSYFYGTAHSASQSYGIEPYSSSDCLVENNIFQQVTTPIQQNASSSGCVFAYNFNINDTYSNPTWMIGGNALHAAGGDNMLWESNEGNAAIWDNIHGTHNFPTAFRNRYSGLESGKSQQTVPVMLYSGTRESNLIGNVLGTSGYHNNYQSNPPSGTNGDTSIYCLGWAGNECTSGAPIANDTLVASTSMRWGNYDTVNNAVRWVSGEVPSGLASYPNPVPASHTLPPSFYLSSQPSWWGTMPWPAIGPDVTGGNIANVGGFAYHIPAEVCYANTMGGPTNGTGSVLSFNASTCYAPVSGGAPPQPSNFVIASLK